MCSECASHVVGFYYWKTTRNFLCPYHILLFPWSYVRCEEWEREKERIKSFSVCYKSRKFIWYFTDFGAVLLFFFLIAFLSLSFALFGSCRVSFHRGISKAFVCILHSQNWAYCLKSVCIYYFKLSIFGVRFILFRSPHIFWIVDLACCSHTDFFLLEPSLWSQTLCSWHLICNSKQQPNKKSTTTTTTRSHLPHTYKYIFICNAYNGNEVISRRLSRL